jgi:hypothetical protein
MKRDAVLKMRQENPDMKSSEIARRLKVKRSYVYSVFYHDKRKQKIAEIREQPLIPVGESLSTASLKREIEELTIIIAYLEHRVKVAEAKHAASIRG